MTAVSTRLLHYGRFAVFTADNRLVYAANDAPDIYGHVWRGRRYAWWEITAGKTGEPLAWGRTWTKGGAWVKAIRAAHRPSVTQEVTR
jgi:hypothetical protein